MDFPTAAGSVRKAVRQCWLSVDLKPYVAGRLEEHTTEVDVGVGTVQMVNDAFREQINQSEYATSMVEEPNVEARRFFDMLDAAINQDIETVEKVIHHYHRLVG